MTTEYNHSSMQVKNPGCLFGVNHGYNVSLMENKLYGQRLKEARERAGLTQKDLEELIGRACTQENISKLERSKTAKGSAYTAAFARACGVRAIWLENGEGPMRDPSFLAPEPQSAAPQQLPESAVTRPPPKHVWNIVAPNEKARTEKVVHIPVLDVQGSQGDGREVPDHEIVASQISVRESWLRRNLAFSAPGNLSIIAGVGDSMKPTFSDGDLLLVDRGVSEIRVDAVYVLELHNKLYIKRLQIRPDGAILMLSDNKAYEPYLIQEADMEFVHVRARVLMAWNANKL